MFLPCLLLLAAVDQQAVASEFPGKVMARAVAHADAVLAEFPPERYFIVGLGITTPLLTAALRLRLRADVPFTDYYFEAPVEHIGHITHYEAPTQDFLLGKIIPAPAVLRGRAVVFLRVLWDGASMKKALPVLVNYVARHRAPSRAAIYFITAGATGLLGDDFAGLVVRDWLLTKGINYKRGPRYRHVKDLRRFTELEAIDLNDMAFLPDFSWRRNEGRFDLAPEVAAYLQRWAPSVGELCGDMGYFLRLLWRR